MANCSCTIDIVDEATPRLERLMTALELVSGLLKSPDTPLSDDGRAIVRAAIGDAAADILDAVEVKQS